VVCKVVTWELETGDLSRALQLMERAFNMYPDASYGRELREVSHDLAHARHEHTGAAATIHCMHKLRCKRTCMRANEQCSDGVQARVSTRSLLSDPQIRMAYARQRDERNNAQVSSPLYGTANTSYLRIWLSIFNVFMLQVLVFVCVTRVSCFFCMNRIPRGTRRNFVFCRFQRDWSGIPMSAPLYL
jgi:hypothetical protein